MASKVRVYALEFPVVRPTAGGVDETSGNAGNEELVWNDEFDDGIELLFAGIQHGVELLGLGNRPGETVKNETRADKVNT